MAVNSALPRVEKIPIAIIPDSVRPALPLQTAATAPVASGTVHRALETMRVTVTVPIPFVPAPALPKK